MTHKQIPDEVKDKLDDDALHHIRVERFLPDLIGFFKPRESGKHYGLLHPGLFTVEVKSSPLKIRDIYQAKMYSEVFDSLTSFLICDHRLSTELERFIPKRSLTASHAGRSQVYIGIFNKKSEEVTKWYLSDPFKEYL